MVSMTSVGGRGNQLGIGPAQIEGQEDCAGDCYPPPPRGLRETLPVVVPSKPSSIEREKTLIGSPAPFKAIEGLCAL